MVSDLKTDHQYTIFYSILTDQVKGGCKSLTQDVVSESPLDVWWEEGGNICVTAYNMLYNKNGGSQTEYKILGRKEDVIIDKCVPYLWNEQTAGAERLLRLFKALEHEDINSELFKRHTLELIKLWIDFDTRRSKGAPDDWVEKDNRGERKYSELSLQSTKCWFLDRFGSLAKYRKQKASTA